MLFPGSVKDNDFIQLIDLIVFIMIESYHLYFNYDVILMKHVLATTASITINPLDRIVAGDAY